jgi:crotonobetainyl-CoA:carnitine CoA-transferase CaiB-like acyl-CoA transferase
MGDKVEVNLLSSILSALVNQASAFVAGGVLPSRMGNAHPSLYPYEPFPTADRNLVIAVGNDAQFTRLCAVLGVPELSVDGRFATMPMRNANREELRALLVGRLRLRGADKWFEALRDARVPSGPILGIDGGIALAEQLGLNPVVNTGAGEHLVPTVRHPVDYRRARVSYLQAPPGLDADRECVLRWIARTRETSRNLAHPPDERPSAKAAE